MADIVKSDKNWALDVKDDALQYIRGKEKKFFDLAPWMGWAAFGLFVAIFHKWIYATAIGAASAAWAVVYAIVSVIVLGFVGKVVFSDKFRDTFLFLVDWVTGWWQEYWERKNPILAIRRTLDILAADLESVKKILAELMSQYLELLKNIRDAIEEADTYRDQSQVALENPKLVPRAINEFDVDEELAELDEFNIFNNDDGANVEAFSMSRFGLAKDTDDRVQRYKNQQRLMADQITDLKTIVSAGEVRRTELEARIKGMIDEFNLNKNLAYAYNAVANLVGGQRFQDLKRQAGLLQQKIDAYRSEALYFKQMTKGIVDDYRAGRAVADFRTRKDYKEFIKSSEVISADTKVKLLGPASPIDTIPADHYLPRTVTEKVARKSGGFDDLV